MKGLIEEGEDMVGNIGESPLRDAGLIAAANRVEHYEIAAYGSAQTFAKSRAERSRSFARTNVERREER